MRADIGFTDIDASIWTTKETSGLHKCKAAGYISTGPTFSGQTGNRLIPTQWKK